tara:strand:- start:2275 stop:3195 length:921 start_codon:yes stop_codon:yes gene_type:complete
MSRATYNNNPTPIAVNRMNFDIKNIQESKETLGLEGLYFSFSDGDQISTRYKMLIVGPEDSPYHNGFYFFDAQFPDQYPFHPMTMKSRTQGGGVRKHPNLYTCGKCCFSFLGTWAGPPWTACQNPKTVAASIRSVLTRYPLENEPGWEKIKDDRQKTYARLITFFNIKWAVVNIVENIPAEYMCFKDDIYKHFVSNYDKYVSTLEPFKKLDSTKEQSPTYGFSITYDTYSVLDRLENIYKAIAPQPKTSIIKPKTISIKVNKKKPTESASSLNVGTKMENGSGEQYIVKQKMRNGKEYKYWSKCKE